MTRKLMDAAWEELYGCGGIPALEVIDPQKRSKYIPLDDLFDDMSKDIRKNNRTNNYLNRKYAPVLEEHMMDLFGIKATMDFTDKTLASTGVLFLNKRHILAQGYLRKLMDKKHLEDPEMDKVIRDMSRGKKGTVNLRTARVGGVFSTYEHSMRMNTWHMVKKARYIPAEMVATLLHETGHIFGNLEYSNRLVSTNQVLQDISTKMKANPGTKLKEYTFALSGAVKNGTLSRKDLDNLKKQNNNIIYGWELSKLLIKSMTSTLPNPDYDTVASEQLADNFATRCGYGRELVTSMAKDEKFGHNQWVEMERSNDIIIAVWTVLASLVPLFLGGPLIVMLPVIAVVWIVTLIGSQTDLDDVAYDELPDRYRRVRDQQVRIIREAKGLSKDDIRSLLKTWELIDGHVKRVDNYKSIYTRLGNLLSSRYRDAADEKHFQQQLEELANNKLFIAAMKIQTA